jgi:hypothetical protein
VRNIAPDKQHRGAVGVLQPPAVGAVQPLYELHMTGKERGRKHGVRYVELLRDMREKLGPGAYGEVFGKECGRPYDETGVDEHLFFRIEVPYEIPPVADVVEHVPGNGIAFYDISDFFGKAER